MYRTFWTSLFVLSTITLGISKTANADLVAKDSATFAYKYDMSADPSERDIDGNGTGDFSKFVSSTGSAAGVNGGVLTINGGGDGYDNRAAYYQSSTAGEAWANSGIAANTGFTVEVKLKVDSMIAGRWGTVAMMTGTAGENYNYLMFRDDGLTWGEKAGPTYTTSTTDGFHVYRLAMQAGQYSFWKDGSLLGSAMTPSESSAINLFRLGDDGSSMNGVTEVEYLRFTAGAYAPVATPEPSAIAILATTIASLSAYAWRRRR